MGIIAMLVVVAGMIGAFATFFIYGQNGSPTWYTAQLTWDGSKFTGGLYATGGTWFAAPWQPGNWSVAQAGTASAFR